jgi:hypothetical protein
VVGDKDEAQRATEFWRFLPKGFKKYYNIADPADIQQQADSEVPLEQIVSQWPIGTDPAIHVEAINKLFECGVTIVNIHSGQPDQKKVIEFYASSVLPKLGARSWLAGPADPTV